jgi:hypothetical protein
VQEARWPAFNANTGNAKSGEKGGFRLFRKTETADRRPSASVLLCPLDRKRTSQVKALNVSTN